MPKAIKSKHEFPEENSPFWLDGSNFLAESAFTPIVSAFTSLLF
jgi:hypothetical protein